MNPETVSNEPDLRVCALREAIFSRTEGEPPESIVRRASVFLDFMLGNDKREGAQ